MTFYVYCLGNLQLAAIFVVSPCSRHFMAILKSFDICVPAIVAK